MHSLAIALLPFTAFAPVSVDAEPPEVATYSIVARDPETGEIGVAVQSKFIAVGAVVPFAKAGVGAVATQAYANVGYGPRALRLLADGASPGEVVSILTRHDPKAARRQFGLLTAEGEAATYTGARCFGWAGGKIGKDCVAQGNILAGEAVVTALVENFHSSAGSGKALAERLIDALDAAEEAGGDRRGKQSAALLVVRENWGYDGGNDRFRDLRVDEHRTPIAELRRIYAAHRKLFPRPDDERE